MRKVLSKNFFERATFEVAEDLLGKFLVIREREKDIAYMITEVEAYDGFEDKASHAYYGKTQRNEVMFGEAGYWYVYFVYGMYNMLNIVTGEKEYPAAVLIRGITDTEKQGFSVKKMFDGPGKLTKILKIDRRFNKMKTNKKTGLWVEDRGFRPSKSLIEKTPRIGVRYAGECAKKPYRFVLVKNKTEITL